MAKIKVQQTDVTILQINEPDYISLTDMAKFKSNEPTDVLRTGCLYHLGKFILRKAICKL